MRYWIVLLAILAGCSPKEEKLNVLFILADDLGYHDLGVTGSAYYETPSIDRIANEGFQFLQGYATCQVCSPSRGSIMTGKYPARTGITDWIGAYTGEDWRKAGRFDKLLPAANVEALPAEDITLAETLKTHGYATFFAGKWHLGDTGSLPEDHGFDINVGGWSKGSPIGGFFDPYENPTLPNENPGENLSIRLARETVSFIEQTDEPFFAFLSFYAVHSPLQTSQTQWARYQQKAEEQGIADTGFEMERVLPIRVEQDNPVYAGMVNTMDEAVGMVLNALEENKLMDNTVVIFTSDNGGVSSGDGYATSNLPLRGGKGYQWEGGLRVPYFIHVPGWSGGSVQTPAIGTDFYPTILEILGLPLNDQQHVDGRSLVSAMKENTPIERPLFWHYPHYGNQGGNPSSVVRDGDWKLIYYHEDGSVELYNLRADPGERTSLVTHEPDVAKRLGGELANWLKEVQARQPQPDQEYDPIAHAAFLEKMRTVRWPLLEQRRKEMLLQDYNPGNDWWGSKLKD